MFTSAQNLAIVRTELDSVFYQEFNRNPMPGIATAENNELFKPINTSHAQYIQEVFKGVDLFGQISETGTVPLSVPQVTNKKTTSIADFARGVELSKNLFDDNMHGVYARMVEDLGRKAAITRDTNAFKIFRGAFSTTLTADGVSFINSAHPLISGGTTSNLVSGALTTLTLNDAIINLGEQKDQAGVVIGNEANILLVPFALYKKAQEITQSVLIADSANNNINVYSSIFGIKVMTSPYLGANAGGSDTAWFLLSRNHSVYRYVRQSLETSLRDWSLSNNRTYFYQANFREEVDVIDYVGAVGSTGL